MDDKAYPNCKINPDTRLKTQTKVNEKPLKEFDKGEASVQVLQFVKRVAGKLNLEEAERSSLTVPQVDAFQAGEKVQAHVLCDVCLSTHNDRKVTVYRSGHKTWVITNYVRHLERYHVKKSVTPNN